MEDFKKDFVPYELALRLKALGFDEPCFAFYNGKHLDLGVWDWEYPAGKKRRDIGECPQAPTFQQAFRWFRGNGFLISLSSHDKNIHDFYLKWSLNKSILSDIYHTNEEAELACLDKLIEIVESKSE